MADVFISYSNHDRELVNALAGGLIEAGFSVWWDRDLKGGTRFAKEIEREIDQAKAIVVVWTEKSISSEWVADEADAGREQGKLLPIALGGTRPPLGFRQYQTIDFGPWSGNPAASCFNALCEALSGQIGKALEAPAQAAESHTPDATIAVLPFLNMSSDPEQEYFSDGISEELLNLLAKINDLTVIARTSSFSFKGSDAPIEEIARKLKTAYILEGSVRKFGNRVRITAQLIETKGSSHLWSDTYDRDLDDIFAIQDEISAAIVKELKGLLLPDAKAPVAEPQHNLKAYEDFLLGHQLMQRRTAEDIQKAVLAFDRALELDPHYARALLGKADAVLLLSDYPGCYGTTPRLEAIEEAEKLLEHAEVLGPDPDELLAIKAFSKRLARDTKAAMLLAEEAIRLNPNNLRAWVTLNFTQSVMGDPRSHTFTSRNKCLELDPLNLTSISIMISEHASRLHIEEAEQLVERAKAINPHSQIWAIGAYAIEDSLGRYGRGLEVLVQNKDKLPPSNFQQHLQSLAAILGEPLPVTGIHPLIIFDVLIDMNRMEEAAPYWEYFKAYPEPLERLSFDGTRMIGHWHLRHGNWEEAEKIMTPITEVPGEEWSIAFNVGGCAQAAFMLLHARQKLGDEDGAGRLLAKLHEIVQITEEGPDDAPITLEIIKAHLAAAEGRNEEAIDILTRYFDRTMCNCFAAINAVTLEHLHGTPAFEGLKARVDQHLAAERQYAVDARLFPLTGELKEIALGG